MTSLIVAVNITNLFIKPYPFFTLNHFTVPMIFFAVNEKKNKAYSK